ncbi:hypothetical protein B0H11DRAFT_2286602 [Mycena galericulata]|nr:hypothetical protein B0H11DRAFT_2110474 [Mycena galericulata]KAJ7458667.1 hypothetical protein B0H11DRAFT_2286602 [Mycena galericulata]
MPPSQLSQFSFAKKPIAVSPLFAERGVREFLSEQGTSISAPATSHNLRKDGGVVSSPAFAAEHAKDAERFAALNLETRDQALSLSAQMKRDFLVGQVSPQVPPAFATGPSLAARPISRTASMASEVLDPATDAPVPTDAVDDTDATPIVLANHKEVSKALHLAAPPTTKAGQKEKPETAVAAAARANGNITRLGGKLLATEAKFDGRLAAVANDVRALTSKVQRGNVGKLEDKIGVLEAMLHSVETKVTTSSDARVTLHASQIARLVDDVETTKHRLEKVTASHICDENGVPYKDYFTTRGDINALYGSVKDALNGVDEDIAEQLAPVLAKVESLVDALGRVEGRLARVEKKLEDGERESLTIRENVARAQTDLSTHIMRTSATGPSVAAVAQPLPPTTNRFEFGVGSGKKHKRKASIELVPGPPKRANAKPEKVAFHHWVNIGPVNDDTRNPAPAFFKKLVEAGTPGYHLPATYIERVAQDPAYLTVGFLNANDANVFVGGWAGAKSSMAAGLRVINATHAAVAGSSSSNSISFLTGN